MIQKTKLPACRQAGKVKSQNHSSKPKNQKNFEFRISNKF